MGEHTRSSVKQRKKRVLLTAFAVVLLILLLCLLCRCSQIINRADNPDLSKQEVSYADVEQEPVDSEKSADIAVNREKDPDEQFPERFDGKDEAKEPSEPEPLDGSDKSEEADNEAEPSKEPAQVEAAAPHDHRYASTVTAPTCVEQGYTTYACSCGVSYQDLVTPATGHSWGAWTITQEPTTSAEGEQARICSTCSVSEIQTLAKLPEEEVPEPTECIHDWKMKYHPEEGHYGDPYVVCKCGFRCNSQIEWLAHVKSYPGEEQLLYHTSCGSKQDYIVDSPSYYEWVCAKCGTVTDVKPE